MVLVLLIISQFTFSKPPEEPNAPPKLVIDDLIRDNCVKQFESAREIQECLVREGAKQAQKEVAEESQKAAEEQREPTQLVCSPEAARRNCENHVISSTKIGNNPKLGSGIKSEAIADCISMCSPLTSYVQRNYLSGCRSTDNEAIKRMAVLSNSCGMYGGSEEYRSMASEISKSAQSLSSEISQGATNLSALSWQDRVTVLGARSGFSNGRTIGVSREAGSATAYSLSNGVEYVKIEAGTGATSYKYRGPDGSLHDNYESAAKARRSPVPKDPFVNTAESYDDENAVEGESISPTELSFGRSIAENQDAKLDYALGEPIQDAPISKAHEPIRQPTKENIESASPSPDPQPIHQQASAPGAFLQNTLNAPIKSATPLSGGSIGNFGGGGEVAQAGSSGSGSNYGGSAASIKDFRPTLSSRGNITNNEIQRSAPTPASIASLDSPLGARGGGIDSAAFVAGQGRLLAASRSSSTFDGSGLSAEKLRSDSFYKTNGRGAQPRSRLVQSDPNCRPTKLRGCAMKRVAIQGAGGTINCEGNPECILKLTGKLKFTGNVARAIDPIGKSERGIASLDSVKRAKSRLPKGVWRGYINVLDHMNNIGADHLKLDHEGFLAVEN